MVLIYAGKNMASSLQDCSAGEKLYFLFRQALGGEWWVSLPSADRARKCLLVHLGNRKPWLPLPQEYQVGQGQFTATSKIQIITRRAVLDFPPPQATTDRFGHC